MPLRITLCGVALVGLCLGGDGGDSDPTNKRYLARDAVPAGGRSCRAELANAVRCATSGAGGAGTIALIIAPRLKTCWRWAIKGRAGWGENRFRPGSLGTGRHCAIIAARGGGGLNRSALSGWWSSTAVRAG